jgi:hypothetical protein
LLRAVGQMGMRTTSLFAILLIALALVGCGGDEELADSDRLAGIGVAQAVDNEGPAVVNGNLLALGDEVRLCGALAESFPPQCGGASIIVKELDLEEVDGLTTEGEVTWSDRPIRVVGYLDDGVLTVDENALE